MTVSPRSFLHRVLQCLFLFVVCMNTYGFGQSTPNVEYEIVLRFECKMSLQWTPNYGRFVFDDGEADVKYFSSCTFENYMWHHALVAIDEDGNGKLFVDGEEQELVYAFDVNDLALGFTEPVGSSFNTTIYPNKQVSNSIAMGRRRSLLQTTSPTAMTMAPTAMVNTTESPTPAPGPDPTLPNMDAEPEKTVTAPTMDERLDGVLGNLGFSESQEDDAGYTGPLGLGGYCTFKMGLKCVDDSVKGFEGLMDEVAVWNRALPEKILPSVMFNMPGYIPEREIEAPRGMQEDYSLGRVFYARFQNPCLEAPLQAPPTPPPPSPVCAEEGCSRRHLMQMSGTDGVRVGFITDQAGYTAGTSDDLYVKTIDLDNDIITFVDFPFNSKYVYGGAPWTPPSVEHVNFTHPNMTGDSIPMDGGVMLTLSGVGFAKSPWLKCAVVQPDPSGLFTGPDHPHTRYKGSAYNESFYDQYWEGLPGNVMVMTQPPFNYEYSSQVLYSNATVHFGNWTDGNRIHWSFEADWDVTYDAADLTRGGVIHPFTANDFDPYNLDFVFGYWEQITCMAPPAAFPSDEYYVGASNDGGVLASPPFTWTYEEYSSQFQYNDGGIFKPPDSLCRAMGQTFTVTMWFYPEFDPENPIPGEQTLLDFTHVEMSAQFTGIFLNSTKVLAYINGRAESNTAVEVTPNEWHYIAFVADVTNFGGRLKFFLDGERQLDDQGEGVDFMQFEPYAQHWQVGNNFNGRIDEIKVLARAVPEEELMTTFMLNREDPANPNDLLAYYRLNYDFNDAFGNYPGTTEGTVTLTPTSSPWEPTIIYAINGNEIDTDNPYINLLKSTLAGNETIEVEGFNLSPSPLLKCGWGPKPESVKGVKLMPAEPNEYVCPVTESTLSRYDGRTPAMEAYSHMMPSPEFITDAVSHSSMKLTCPSPTVENARSSFFTVGLGPTYNFLPFESTERSLSCDGMGGYLSADDVTAGFDAMTNGYTVSMWVKPALMDMEMEMMDDGMEMSQGRARSMLQNSGGKRFNRRRAMEQPMFGAAPFRNPNPTNMPPGHPYPGFPATTVMAFEDEMGGNQALILYDGTRFMYYDDRILDATTFTLEGSAPGEWHVVSLTWRPDGEGDLYVDNKPREHFTTKSFPRSAYFSLCQDYDSNLDASSFFAGMVDSVRIYNSVVPIDPAVHNIMEWPAQYWAMFDFKMSADPMPSPERGEAELEDGAMLMATSAPWSPPNVTYVDPPHGTASANTVLEVYGTNMDLSRWFALYVGETKFMRESMDVIKGTVSEEVGVRLLSPFVDTCQTVSVNASNNNGTDIGMGAPHEYKANNEDLTKGLIGYWDFDLVDRMGEQTLFMDHVGDNHFMYFADYATIDKDNFEDAAVFFGSGIEGGHIKLAKPLMPPGMQSDITMCWWMFLDVDYLEVVWRHAQRDGDKNDDFPPLSEQLSLIAGAWRMFSWVHTQEPDEQGRRTHIFVNNDMIEEENPVNAVLQSIFDVAMEDQLLTCGPYDGLNCIADTLYVYDRALKPCEIRERFRSQKFALDMTKKPEGVTGMIPYDREFHSLTVEAWVWPFSVEKGGSVLTVDEVFDFGLAGDSVSFGAYTGCDCLPCAEYEQYNSFRSKAPPGRWTHIAATYDGGKIVFFTDGILKDVRVLNFTAYPYISTGNLDVDGAPGGPTHNPPIVKRTVNMAKVTMGAGINGLIYDVRFTPAIIEPLQDMWDFTVCPRLKELHLSTYFQLNEGTGDKAYADHIHPDGGNKKLAVFEGLNDLWYNFTYDDPTFVPNTVFFGDARFGAEAGHAAKFTLVSKTKCHKKKISGGDPWSVYFQVGNNKLYPTPNDNDDGNYDYYYWAGQDKLSLDNERIIGEGFPCGNYTGVAEYDGTPVFSWPVAIRPSFANITESFIIGGAPSEGPYGVINTFVIQINDSNGCNAWGEGDLDRIEVNFFGIYNFSATITPLGMGQYLVSYVPEVPGQYQVRALLDGEVIGGGQFCYQATEGTSVYFDGFSSLTVEEQDGVKYSDIDMAFFELTIEMWIMITSNSDGYLVFKGSSEELANNQLYTKGYEMRLTADTVSMSLYVGGGRIRTVSFTNDESFPIQTWHHLAGVYNGTASVFYLNGEKVASAEFEDRRRVEINMYDHPLTIGYGFIGYIDDLRMWRVARGEDEIRDTRYCPPPLEMLDDLAGYFTFNEGTGNTTLGHSFQCGALELDCLVGVHSGGVYENVNDTEQVGVFEQSGFTVMVQGDLTAGIGAPSERFSTFTIPDKMIYAGDTNPPAFEITARDKCGYEYRKGNTSYFTSTTNRFSLRYFDDNPPSGTAYPTLVNTATTSRSLDVVPSVCPNMFSNIYTSNLQDLTEIGTWFLDPYVDGKRLDPEKTYKVFVATNEPKTFSLDGPGNIAPAVAGVPRAANVQLFDEFGNLCYTKYDFTATLTLLNRAYSMVYTVDGEDMLWNEETFSYTFFYTVGLEGDYDFDLMREGMTTLSSRISVQAAPWQEVHVVGGTPDEVDRFEHSAVVYEDSVYLFGGASKDKTYLNDIWVLEETNIETLSYKKDVFVDSPNGEMEDVTVEFTVNTLELVEAGRMRPDCTDIMFVKDGIWEKPMSFYLDPYPGCNTDNTIIFLRVPKLEAGNNQFLMVYGNPEMAVNPTHLPDEVFEFYDGFERPEKSKGEDEFSPMGKFMTQPPCGEEESGDPNKAPITTSEQRYSGKNSLYFRWGEPYVLSAKLKEPLSQFKMRAWLWDSDSTESAHYMSPNFGECEMVNDEDKARLPDGYGPLEARSVAVGTFTLSNKMQYCVSSPWQRSGVMRSANWHQLEIVSTLEGTLKVSIDGQVVKAEDGNIIMDKVLLSGGFGVDGKPHTNLKEAHAFWDEVSVLKLVPATATAGAMDTDMPNSFNNMRMWKPVMAKGEKPPPRYSHTALMWEDKMVIFGGERSAHSHGDVWMFHMEESRWEYIAPQGWNSPIARFDHTAVIKENKMYVYGGRSGKTILSDFWEFDLVKQNWTILNEGLNDCCGPRFGHAAALQEGTDLMYVFGGYVPEQGMSDDFFRCDVVTGACQDMKAFCLGKPDTDPFPDALSARYGHSAWADENFLYIYGGSDLSDISKVGFSNMFRLALDPELNIGFGGCSWDEVPIAGEQMDRYEHATAAGDGRFLVQGGHDRGTPDGSMYFIPVA